MVTIQGGRLVPIPFAEIIDPRTKRVRVRYVDVTSEMYQMLFAYMIRLKPEDLAEPTRGAHARRGEAAQRGEVRRTIRAPRERGRPRRAGEEVRRSPRGGEGLAPQGTR